MTTPASLIQPDAFLSPLAIDEAVSRALSEDLGRAGDITSIATIPETAKAHAGGNGFTIVDLLRVRPKPPVATKKSK